MTDYFKMMQDVVGSYGEGVEFARQRDRQIEADKRAKTKFEQDTALFNAGMAEKRRIADINARTDKAWSDKADLATNGVYNAGMSDASRAGLSAAGGQGLVDETTRLAAAENAQYGITPPKSEYRKATERDFLNADRAVAIAKQDQAGELAARGGLKKLDIYDTTNDLIKKAAENPEFLSEMAKHLNLNNGRTTIDTGLDPKTGKKIRPASISYVQDDGGVHVVKPSPSQMKVVASALAHMQHGETEQGIQLLASVDKTLADQAAREAGLQHQNFDSNVKAQGEWDTNQYHLGSLANQREQTKAIKSHYDRPDVAILEDAKGEAVMVDKRTLPVGKDGVYALPPGLRMPRKRPEIDQVAVAKAMESLTGEDAKLPFAQRYGLVVNALYGKETGGLPSWGGSPKASPGQVAATPAAPIQQYDRDGMPIPLGRQLSNGYSTLDASGLLRTPKYSSGTNTFYPKD